MWDQRVEGTSRTLLKGLVIVLGLLANAAVQGGVFVYQSGPPKTGDLYIVNNTGATVTLANHGIPIKNAFNTTTVAPWGVASSTNVPVDLSNYDQSQSMSLMIQAQGNLPAYGFQVVLVRYNNSNDVRWDCRSDDPSWVQTDGQVAPSGVRSFGNGSDGSAQQVYNSDYVVTLIAFLGDDDPSSLTAWKIFLVISRNSPTRLLYQEGLPFPWPPGYPP